MFKNALKITGAIFYTIRPSATFGACLLVAAAFKPQIDEWPTLALLLSCAFFGAAYCFLMNDIYDREKDLLNHKYRPIATGELPLKTAVLIAVVFGILFLALAFPFGWTVFGLAIVFILLATFYSYFNFQSGFLANFIVAFIVSGTQWGVAIIKPEPYLISMSLFLLFFTIPREMILDWLDIEGDKAHGKHSLAIKASQKRFNWIIVLFLLGSTAMLCFLLFTFRPPLISLLFFLGSGLMVWVSFLRFFDSADRKNALFAVRSSHLTFAMIIIAMIFR